MESEVGAGGGISIDFPANEGSLSAVKVPRRLRRRLMECKSPCVTTVQEIEAKLQEANLRRQQFHGWLSSKARRKSASPSWSSSQDEDLGQRLEAKLHAAEQKRLSIIAKAQKRLARLDELRQAAKNGVEMRIESKREELGTKVESRVQQAEVNRMLLLKAHRQRRAEAKERTAQSLSKKMAQERKYKECVRAAIQQKRAAAEKKRLGLLEAEKSRVHARVMRVRRVAKSVFHQRETERRRLKDQLEDRLQRARSQRAEYLRQRGSVHSPSHLKMHKEGDILSRKLARCWRRFLRSRKTTLSLTKEYEALNISDISIKSMPFEQLALLIESNATLQTVKAFLDRLEKRYTLSLAATAANGMAGSESIDHLLKRLASPKRRTTPGSATRSRRIKKGVSSREGAQNPAKLSRYPVRVVLCAYMILGHPDAVFNEQGEHEIALAESAKTFIREFELLTKIISDGPSQTSHPGSPSTPPSRRTFKGQLECFDAAWRSYLYNFVVWKVKDARSLEEDLVRAACQLELSMMQTCKISAEGDSGDLTHDMKAVQAQVTEDKKLLREKVLHLSGDAGIQRMESALSNTRSRFFEGKENGSPLVSPISQISSSSVSTSSESPSVSNSAERQDSVEGFKKSNRVVRSLFKNNDSSEPSSTPSSIYGQLGSLGDKSVTENELLVNEIIHEHRQAFADSFSINDEDQNNIKIRMRETMEKAFWNSIEESMRTDNPDYSRIIELMKEVRDELCEMAPQSWKQNILDAIDLDILSQVLMSGSCDMDYLGKILEFALVTLVKLSAPASENDMTKRHENLVYELCEISQAGSESYASFIIALIKGLRFVLEQIQVLKREISKARIKMLEPVIQGPAGLEYLGNAFANRCGDPADASKALPVTVQWILSVQVSVDEEWHEHTSSLSILGERHTSSYQGLPSNTTLRTGCNVSILNCSQATHSPNSTPTNANSTTGKQPECTGERVDMLIRLGLLKLVSNIEGITQETLPETLKLNMLRLRAIQAQVQKIIVISTSMLVLHQTLLGENSAISPSEVESVISNSYNGLSELLDRVEDVGTADIIETISTFSVGDISLEPGKLQARKEMMANMLKKSLKSGDVVFTRVSRAVYQAFRGVMFGGSGMQGRELAETALRRVGAAALTDRVMEAAEVLIVVATVTGSVHGPWYAEIVKNIM